MSGKVEKRLRDKSLYVIIRDSNGKKTAAKILFFLIDPNGGEYVAYLDLDCQEEGGTLRTAVIKRSVLSYRIEDLPRDHFISRGAYAVWEDSKRQGSLFECRGESYRVKAADDESGELRFFRTKTGKRAERLVMGGMRDSVSFALMLVVVFCGVLAAAFMYGRLTSPSQMEIYEQTKSGLPSDEEYFSGLRSVFEDEIWANMSNDEKLEILSEVCRWECANVLGCRVVELEKRQLEENNLAFFDSGKECIVLNEEMLSLSTWQTAVKVLAHETRHVWQSDMVRLLELVEDNGSELSYLNIFDSVREYREVFGNYTSGLDDYEVYYEQAIEEDSRQWAEGRSAFYATAMSE